MIDLRALDGKALTLLLMGTRSDGTDDWAVFGGVARFEADTLYLDRGAGRRFAIQPEWVDRIRPPDPAIRHIFLDADYYLPLVVGNLPADEDPGDFVRTGLKWPE